MATISLERPQHKVVSKKAWVEARLALMAKEKEMTRLRDELNQRRLGLPWVKVDKDYTFDGPDGKVKLADLFCGRSQLVVYHFMFGPEWNEGCPSCSFLMDNVEEQTIHLNARDITFVAVSRAPLAKLQAFEKRMGWDLPWYSSFGSDFNFDFGVSFTKEQIESGEELYNFGTQKPYADENHGVSCFYRDEDGQIFHTYSVFARGAEPLISTYTILDWAPKGRDESGFPYPMAWVRHHDKYEAAESSSCCHA